jgi:hypothetical protein
MAGLQALIACEQTGQVLICVLELSFTMNDSGPSASAVICSRMDHVTRWRLPIEAVATQIPNQHAGALCLSGSVRHRCPNFRQHS